MAFLVHQNDDYRISSGDAIVHKVLGNLNLGDQGISLEEILGTCGLGRKIDGFQYTKAFREQLTRLGATDMVQGRGRKRKQLQTEAKSIWSDFMGKIGLRLRPLLQGLAACVLELQ